MEMQNYDELILPECVEAKAIFLYHKDVTENDSASMEEYEYDLVYNKTKQRWTTTLSYGHYLLTVKFKDHKEINEVIHI